MPDRDLRDALRPFALFAIEARMSDDARIVYCAGGDDVAVLTAQDFREAAASYAVSDDLCLKALELTGRSTARELRKRRGAGPRIWPWLMLFFFLGLLAGAAA